MRRFFLTSAAIFTLNGGAYAQEAPPPSYAPDLRPLEQILKQGVLAHAQADRAQRTSQNLDSVALRMTTQIAQNPAYAHMTAADQIALNSAIIQAIRSSDNPIKQPQEAQAVLGPHHPARPQARHHESSPQMPARPQPQAERPTAQTLHTSGNTPIVFCPSPLAADQCEIQVVGIYESHGPAQLTVDRPNKHITLVLAAYEDTDWHITATPGTTISTVMMAGYGTKNSTFEISGNAGPEPRRIDAPHIKAAYQAPSAPFETMMQAVRSAFGTDKVHGFVGLYDTVPQEPLRVDTSTPENPMFADPEHRPPHPDSVLLEDLPAAFQDALSDHPEDNTPALTARLGPGGFEITHPDGRIQHLSPKMGEDRISHPTNVVVDDQNNRVYAASLGGDGGIYLGDMDTGTFETIASADGADFTHTFFDGPGTRLVFTGNMRPGIYGIWTFDLNRQKLDGFSINADLFPGLTNLYDPGNGPAPELRILASENNSLLVRATPRHGHPPHLRNTASDPLYTLDLTSQKVAPVLVEKPIDHP